MNIRRSAIIALTGILASAILSGCSADRLVREAKEKENTPSDKVYKVGVCQLVQHEALDAATKGFKDALSKRLGDRVIFDEQNASNDPATCSTIVNQFISSNTDLIFANSTQALQAASSATHNIPIIATSVTDYATALDIADWTGKTGMNITGTSDIAPLKDQAAMFRELLPDIKNIGIIYCLGEANSKYQIEIVSKELERLGYNCELYGFTDSNDVASVVTTACSESDALYLPTDNTAAANAEIIFNIAEPERVPVITGEEGPCRICGIATLTIDYYSIGEIAGEMAYEVLEKGKNPADMEIRFAQKVTGKYNPELAELLGITIPEGYEPLSAE